MSSKVTCSCGWSWDKKDSSKKDMYVCHQCGKDNTMKDGGWLSKYDDGGPVQENYNDADAFYSEDYVGAGYDIEGRNYSPAWGGQFEHGGTLPGSVGFSYARTKGIPSNGPYAKKTKASAQDGTVQKPVDLNKPIALNEVVVTPVSKRVEAQRDIIQKTKPKQNYSIVDKKNNIIHYYNPSGELISKENVITGASNVDSENALSMREYFENKDTDSHEDYFKYLKDTESQTTPAGIFNITSLRENTAKNPDKLGSLFNKVFRPQREEDIENIRLQDYGEQQKLFTLASEYGVPSSKAIHGTLRDNRVKALADNNADRNLSNGCINVNGETVCFDTLGKGSSVYVLPEENDELLHPDQKRKSGKGTNKVYTNTKSTITDALYSRGIKASKDAIDFISSVAEKETKGGRSKSSKLQTLAPYAIAGSQGMFEINPNPEAFGKYLPKDFDNSIGAGAEAVYNFYKSFDNLDPVKKYQEYTGGKDGRYDKAFKKIYDKMSKVYEDGGVIAQNGKEMQFYQNGLDWKPKSISRDGSVIEDDRGQWDHPGEITKINSNEITMQGVDYPVLGISDTGDTQMMQPGEDYTYDGKSVTEYPMMKDGGWLSKYDLPKAQTGKDLDFKSLMNPGIKQDATKVVRQEIMSEAEAKKLKARKDAEELARRKQAIATSAAAKDPRNQGKFLNPLENLADETGAIGDKLRLFPNDPDSFIDDYLNPGVMVGNIASGLGRVPLNIDEGNYGEAAMAIGIPLAFGAMEQLAAPYTNKLLRPVTQYLPEKGQVINELSNLKKAAFPNKPTFINPNEQELLSTVRNVGIMTKTGTNDAAVLEKILNKSSNLSDDEFQNLVGSTRSELEGKIQTLKEAGATKKPNAIASELSSDNDVDPSWIRMQERLRARGHNFPSTSSPEEVINLARPNRSQDINRAIASGILNEPQLATPQEFILDIGSGFNWKPSLENKSLIKGLTDKINTKRYLPVSNEKGQSLLPSLYRTDTNNPVAEIIKAYRTLESSPKGSTFKSASSLSTDSYPATLKMTQKALSNNLAELNYTGMGTLNSSGFSQSAGLSKNLNLKEINTMIDMLNKKLPKPIPYAYKEGSDIIAPQVSLTRKKNGGWLSKYN